MTTLSLTPLRVSLLLTFPPRLSLICHFLSSPRFTDPVLAPFPSLSLFHFKKRTKPKYFLFFTYSTSFYWTVSSLPGSWQSLFKWPQCLYSESPGPFSHCCWSNYCSVKILPSLTEQCLAWTSLAMTYSSTSSTSCYLQPQTLC